MSHHKRGRAKNARGAERSDAYATEPEDPSDYFDADDPDTHQRHWSDWQEMKEDEMTDERRKLIAEAMEARMEAEPGMFKTVRVVDHAVERYLTLSHNAIPAAVELIEELTEEVADLRAGQANDDRDHRASVATIAKQAKEIDRLKAEGASAEARVKELVNVRQLLWDENTERGKKWREAEATIAEQAEEVERLTGTVRALADELGDDWEDYGVHDD